MTKFIMPAASREDIRRGIFYAVISVFMFAIVNALVKWQSERYPVTEIVFFRCLFAMFPTIAFVMANRGLSELRTRRLGEHFARSVIQFMGMMCIFTAFSLMPLADAVAITFASPLFMTVLSIPLLGERVGLHRWGAVLVGFGGILVMVRPGPGILESGAIFALANAFLSASVTVALRRMSVTESSATIVFYQISFNTLCAALLLPFGWITPTWADTAVLIFIGLCAGVGQYWWAQAFRFAPAAVAAPFSYLAMVWAVLFGFLMWGDIPTTPLVIGACIVVLSGLYILYRETVRRTNIGRHPATGDE